MEGYFDFACRADIPDLQELWRQCFQTEDDYTDFYFSRRFVPEDTLIWRVDGKAVSMLTLMDVLMDGEKGSYLYAVATLPAFQRQGIYRRLDEAATEEIRRRGSRFSCLVPAEPSLFSMYRKLGYQTAFWTEETVVQSQKDSCPELRPCPFDTFLKLRRQYLQELPRAIVHPARELRYIYDELRAFSGEVWLYEEEDRLCYAAVTDTSTGIYLRECSGLSPQKAAQSLLTLYGKSTAKIHSPAGENPMPFGMMKRLSTDKSEDNLQGYMALMLD